MVTQQILVLSFQVRVLVGLNLGLGIAVKMAVPRFFVANSTAEAMFIEGLRQFASDPRIPKNACDCTHACPEDRLGYM